MWSLRLGFGVSAQVLGLKSGIKCHGSGSGVRNQWFRSRVRVSRLRSEVEVRVEIMYRGSTVKEQGQDLGSVVRDM